MKRTDARLVSLVLFIAAASAVLTWWAMPGVEVGGHEKSRYKATIATMRTIENTIKSYKAEKGVYPPNLQALVQEKYIEKLFKDAWRRDLIYAIPGPAGHDYALISLGADGRQGTEDDIDVWRIDETN